MCTTFKSRPVFTPLLALGTLALPLIAVPSLGRWGRRLGRRFVKQDAAKLAIKATEWQHYEIDWSFESVTFRVDNQMVLQTTTSPIGPLGLVIWIDNQYAAFLPDGRLRYGNLPNTEPAWIEVDHLKITRGG